MSAAVIPLIRSRDNTQVKRLLRLAVSSRKRRETGTTILDGAHLVDAYGQSGGTAETLIASESAYADAGLNKFTKRLIFSSWKVVPKVVSTLLSYEVERRMIRELEGSPENTPEARKKRKPPMRFARSEGRLTGMPLLGLIYPCRVEVRPS